MSRSPIQTEESIRISEVTKRTGITSRTLRYWEEIGLLESIEGPVGTERRYLPDILDLITTVRTLQSSLGFSLTEIKALVDTDRTFARVKSLLRAEPTEQERKAALLHASEVNQALISRLVDRNQAINRLLEERLKKQARLEELIKETS